MNKQDWSAALGSFTQVQREKNPVLSRSRLSHEEEWQCRVIGGEFIGWYKQHLRGILEERMALQVIPFDPEPLIVFTTTMPGLVAAQEIMPDPPKNLFYLLHSEFEEWEKQHQVDNFTFHIHHWSYFREIDQELLEQAQKAFPKIKIDQYRLHISGDLWGKQCGVEGKHLWCWTDEGLELLEEAFSQTRF